MEGFQAALLVAAMFILRLAIPLALMLSVGYWLKQLDARWQAEALARRANVVVEREAESEQAVKILKVIDPPCWVTRDCAESKRIDCPACRLTDIPCWLARLRLQGHLSARCYDCERFVPRRQAPALARQKAGDV